MRKILLVILAMTFAAGSAYAGGCDGCDEVKLFGYMAPNFRMIDQGEDNASDMGFGMAYCRFVFTGAVEGGAIVKKIGWRVETDISQPGRQGLQYAWMQMVLSDQFALRMGRDKMPFSLETLYSTAGQLTADRHVSDMYSALGYAAYGYGLEGFYKHEMFKAHFGVYDGEGANMNVANQDPALTMGLRVVVSPPVEGLEIGANVVMQSLPEGGSDNTNVPGSGQGVYVDDGDTEYMSNSGMAFGADVQYKAPIGEEMHFHGQAEFGSGDNWALGAKDAEVDDTWEDYEWYSFQYFYVKALLKVTKDFGFHVGFSSWDPNTDAGVGKNDGKTKITPGVDYWWAKNFRTIVEVQMCTDGGGVDALGEELDDVKYTSFVLQNVWIWP